MERLKELYYSTDVSYNRSNSSKRYIWKFYDENNCLCNLEYKHSIYRINALNRDTMIRSEIEQSFNGFMISCQDKRQSQKINDIDNWLKDNFKYIKKSYDNCMKSFEIIDYIKMELGDYNYATTYEIGWSIKDFYKLSIDLYSIKIILNYKGKETQLTEQKLKTFIQKNKKAIIQAKENDYKKYLQRKKEAMEQRQLQQITERTENLTLQANYDATRKVNYKGNSSGFYIPRTLKQRYEAQACKPFPEKYPWISK